MTDENPEAYQPPPDTPGDDPAGDPPRPGGVGAGVDDLAPPWQRPRTVAAALIVFVVLVLVGLAVLAVLRRVWRFFRTLFAADPSEPIMFTADTASYMGPVYEIHFFDRGMYRQLADVRLSIACDLHDPLLDRRLAARAAQLAALVESRDSQRHFGPSAIVLVDGRGWPVHEWHEVAPLWVR